MFDLSVLGTFILVVLGLFLIPGPAVILVFTRTLQGGRCTGIMTGLGIATGDFIHTIFAAVGLSAILMTSALAFTIVKVVGAAYLIYLGLNAIWAKQTPPNTPQTVVVSAKKAFLQAIPAEVLNPKTALFFLAFMPQFVSPTQGSVFVQFTVLGLIFVVLSSIYSTLLALSVKPLTRLLKHLAPLQRWQGKIIGGIFIALGLKVAVQQH